MKIGRRNPDEPESQNASNQTTNHCVLHVLPFLGFLHFLNLLLLALSPFFPLLAPVASEPGVVNFLIESMPTNLDPRIGIDAQSERIDSLIFSGLIELDSERNPRADLAEKWETPDPLTYIFHLRSGVKFHVMVERLTSADVVIRN